MMTYSNSQPIVWRSPAQMGALLALVSLLIGFAFAETIQDMLHRFSGEVAQLPGAVTDAMHFHSRITEAIAIKDADLAEREMVLHLFDVVGRIESNLKIDLNLETMCGVDLIQFKALRNKHPDPQGPIG